MSSCRQPPFTDSPAFITHTCHMSGNMCICLVSKTLCVFDHMCIFKLVIVIHIFFVCESVGCI